MRRRVYRRRGIQLVEVMLILPVLGMVLTALGLSVAATQRILERVQHQSLELATTDRFAQQLREDVHRAIRLPLADGQTLRIDRLEGSVRYQCADKRVVRTMETPLGSALATFEIDASETPWMVAPEDGFVRFAWDDESGGREVAAAWQTELPQTQEQTQEQAQ